MKPRLLIITNRITIGGPASVVVNLANDLKDSYEIKIAGGKPEPDEYLMDNVWKKQELNYTWLPSMKRNIKLFRDIKTLMEMDRLIREFRPHIVHTNASKPGFAGRIIAKKNRVPVIVHTFHGHVFHSYFNKTISRLFLLIERVSALISTRIITISDTQYKDITENYKIAKPSRTVVIPVGINPEIFQNKKEEKRLAFRSKNIIKKETIAIGIISRLVPVKNLPFFIELANKLKHSSPIPFRFFVIGDGEKRSSFEKQAKDRGLTISTMEHQKAEADITFFSWYLDITEALAGLDIVCQTSRNEGTPLSLIEAQAAMTPVVSTDAGGVKDCMIHGDTGFIVPQDALGSYVEAVIKLASDEELRNKMGTNGYNFVKQNFSLKQMGWQTQKLYDHLLQLKNIS